MTMRQDPAAVLADIRTQIERVISPDAVRDALAGITGEVEAVRDMLIQEGRKAESGVFDALRGGLLNMDSALGNVRRNVIDGVDQLVVMADRLKPR